MPDFDACIVAIKEKHSVQRAATADLAEQKRIDLKFELIESEITRIHKTGYLLNATKNDDWLEKQIDAAEKKVAKGEKEAQEKKYLGELEAIKGRTRIPEGQEEQFAAIERADEILNRYVPRHGVNATQVYDNCLKGPLEGIGDDKLGRILLAKKCYDQLKPARQVGLGPCWNVKDYTKIIKAETKQYGLQVLLGVPLATGGTGRVFKEPQGVADAATELLKETPVKEWRLQEFLEEASPLTKSTVIDKLYISFLARIKQRDADAEHTLVTLMQSEQLNPTQKLQLAVKMNKSSRKIFREGGMKRILDDSIAKVPWKAQELFKEKMIDQDSLLEIYKNGGYIDGLYDLKQEFEKSNPELSEKAEAALGELAQTCTTAVVRGDILTDTEASQNCSAYLSKHASENPVIASSPDAIKEFLALSRMQADGSKVKELVVMGHSGFDYPEPADSKHEQTHLTVPGGGKFSAGKEAKWLTEMLKENPSINKVHLFGCVTAPLVWARLSGHQATRHMAESGVGSYRAGLFKAARAAFAEQREWQDGGKAVPGLHNLKLGELEAKALMHEAGLLARVVESFKKEGLQVDVKGYHDLETFVEGRVATAGGKGWEARNYLKTKGNLAMKRKHDQTEQLENSSGEHRVSFKSVTVQVGNKGQYSASMNEERKQERKEVRRRLRVRRDGVSPD